MLKGKKSLKEKFIYIETLREQALNHRLQRVEIFKAVLNEVDETVEINGAKNAAVAILPAAILAEEGKCIIDNIPDIEDVHCLERILLSLGCTVKKLDNNTKNYIETRACLELGGLTNMFTYC